MQSHYRGKSLPPDDGALFLLMRCLLASMMEDELGNHLSEDLAS
ncbi:hypothetical protein ACFX5U_08580 [Sphingobacterium sp. SG20118]